MNLAGEQCRPYFKSLGTLKVQFLIFLSLLIFYTIVLGHREGTQWVKAGSTPKWVASSSQGPTWAFVGSMPCSRVPWTVLWRYSGTFPYFQNTFHVWSALGLKPELRPVLNRMSYHHPCSAPLGRYIFSNSSQCHYKAKPENSTKTACKDQIWEGPPNRAIRIKVSIKRSSCGAISRSNERWVLGQ